MSEITNKIIPIDQLKPHPRNYKKHPETQIKRLMASVTRFSQVRSIVVQEGKPGQYMLVAGHGFTEAAKLQGLTELRADVIPATWTDEQVSGYLVADNLLGATAEDNNELLAEILQEQANLNYDLASLGSSQEDLDALLEMLAQDALGELPGEGQGGDEFQAEPDEENTIAKLGDIWELGNHRIGCLNSCDEADVKRLLNGIVPDMVFADPPYGISIVATNVSVGGGEAYDIPFGSVKNTPRQHSRDVGGGQAIKDKTGHYPIESLNKKSGLGSVGGAKPFGKEKIQVRGSVGTSNLIPVGKYYPVIGDDSTETAVNSYRLSATIAPKAIHIWWGGNYYANALPPSSCWLVWDKENTGNFADAELAWTNQPTAVRIFKHMWNGMLKDSEQGVRRVHPTQKPIALAEWCYTEYGKEKDIIFDPFLGSGMSLIAAERTGRTVYGCELSPAYIDVVIKRFEAETGQTAKLLDRVGQEELTALEVYV